QGQVQADFLNFEGLVDAIGAGFTVAAFESRTEPVQLPAQAAEAALADDGPALAQEVRQVVGQLFVQPDQLLGVPQLRAVLEQQPGGRRQNRAAYQDQVGIEFSCRHA